MSPLFCSLIETSLFHVTVDSSRVHQKQHYPHYYHLKGRNGEPVFFELPPKTNLQAMRKGGVDLPSLLRHYAMVTEFQWQFVERDDFARSITVIDLEGMRMTDFVGECVDYVRKCSEFTGQHYPERAGTVLVINVPGWFKMIWNVVKPMVDEVTLRKIRILRGKEEIFNEVRTTFRVLFRYICFLEFCWNRNSSGFCHMCLTILVFFG